MKELRGELNRLQAEFDQKWSSQIKMVKNLPSLNPQCFHFLFDQVDANNRSVFKMNDKMSIVTDWLRTLGMCSINHPREISVVFDCR